MASVITPSASYNTQARTIPTNYENDEHGCVSVFLCFSVTIH